MANKRALRRERKEAIRAKRAVSVEDRKKLSRVPNTSHQHFAYHLGWAPDDGPALDAEIANVKRGLTVAMGETRTSAVKMLTASGPEKAHAALDEMKPGDDHTFADLRRRIRAKVREFGGVVVIAYAEREPTL